MTAPEFTLKNARETAKIKVSRASDFLTKEEIKEVHESNIKGKKNLSYNQVDAYIAEILARFGYDTYVAWKFGEISEVNMVKYIEAERARETRNRLKLEQIMVASMAGANNPVGKSGKLPKTLKTALKMLKNEEKMVKGGF